MISELGSDPQRSSLETRFVFSYQQSPPVFVSALAYVGYANNQGLSYYAIAVGSAVRHIVWQIATVNFDSKADCMAKFISNGTMGYFIWAGMLADYIVKVVL